MQDKAFDLISGCWVSIPKVKVLTGSPVFYAVRTKIPYGLDSKPGQLVICASLKGGVAIKGWRFDDGEWKMDFQGGGIHLDHHSGLVAIESPSEEGKYSVWLAARSEAWRNPGSVKYFRRTVEWSHIHTEENIAFQDFMDQHWPQARK
jgi:hypothetical protein